MNFLKNRRCYISGAIENSKDYDWRNEPISRLREELGVEVFDPFSDPKQNWKPSLEEARKTKNYELMRKIAKSFVKKDLKLIEKSDFLIANIDPKIPSIGMWHEIFNSNSYKNPTLLVCEPREQIPFWLFGVIPLRYMFNSWQEVFQYLHEVDIGKHKEDDRWAFVYGLI